MNIKITHSWLMDYLDTDATPQEIQKYLSLSGPAIERVEKVDDDCVYDIEITTNRIDMASVIGIAQEAQAILPQHGKKAKLKKNPLTEHLRGGRNVLLGGETGKQLNISILNPDLCSRFTAIVLSDITIAPSPDFIQKRLKLVGIKVINNVVDISNYLMLTLGQPTHIFDYDAIAKNTMIMRESKKGEKITTLDEREITLPGGDIVIEDGSGNLIDLCGIMGGLNSSVTEKTKNILLFVQTYNKRKIRRTSMTTAQRSVAATYFEKGLDEERVEPTLMFGVELLKTYTKADVSSQLYDIYPNPVQPKKITASLSAMNTIIGVDISADTVIHILNNLGFSTTRDNDTLTVEIPSWRHADMDTQQDVIEEVARVYGYGNLPNIIQPTLYVKQPQDIELLFSMQSKVKHFLKHIGLHETMNYSMISEETIRSLDFSVEDHMMLQNTISEEIKYLRTSLMPSLLKNITDNTGKKDPLKFFEIAKVYRKKPDDLPDEHYKLGIAVTTDFFDLKGIVETLLDELNISDYEIVPLQHRENRQSATATKPVSSIVDRLSSSLTSDVTEIRNGRRDRLTNQHLFSQNIQAILHLGNTLHLRGGICGSLGQVKQTYLEGTAADSVFLAELDFHELIAHYKLMPLYVPPNPYATVKLDLTISLSLNYSSIVKKSKELSPLISRVEVISLFQNKLSLRYYFSSPERNITEEEAKGELEKIRSHFQRFLT